MISLIFGIMLIACLLLVILDLFGIDVSDITTFRWGIALRVILAICVGLVICFFLSYISATAGVVGLLVGGVIGALIPTLFAWAWKLLKWWMKILLIIVIFLGIFTIIF